MSIVRALVSAVLVAAYAGASALPCEPVSLRSGTAAADPTQRLDAGPADAGHAHAHAAASADHGRHEEVEHHASAAAETGEAASPAEATHGDCHEPPSLLPRCSCGCDEKSRARTPGARLGPVLLTASVEGLPARGASLVPATPMSVLDVPMLPPELIPI